jgi:hypothetical protein
MTMPFLGIPTPFDKKPQQVQYPSPQGMNYNPYPGQGQNQQLFPVSVTVDRDPRTLGIDTHHELEEIKMSWMGFKRNSDNTRWVPIPGADRMISEYGAERILGMFRSCMTIANATTNLNEDQIAIKCIIFGFDLNEMVCQKYMDFQIPKPYFDFIINPLLHSYHNFLLKSLNDKQRSFQYQGGLLGNPTPIQQNPTPTQAGIERL